MHKRRWRRWRRSTAKRQPWASPVGSGIWQHRRSDSVSSPSSLTGDAGQGSADPQSSLDCSRQAAGNLRHAADATAMIHRDLENAQFGAGRPHLHFEVPTIGHLAHAEPKQRLAADRTKRAHVGKTSAVKQTQREAGSVAGNDLMRVHTAGFTAAAGARTNNEIEPALDD